MLSIGRRDLLRGNGDDYLHDTDSNESEEKGEQGNEIETSQRVQVFRMVNQCCEKVATNGANEAN